MDSRCGLRLPPRPRQATRRRSGNATLELAICLPVIMLIVAGAVEGANFAFLRQTLTQSAYEGIKVTTRRGNTANEGITAAQLIVQQRNIQGVTFQFQPADPSTVPAGSPITLIVTAAGDANSQFPVGPFSGRSISVRATMARE